MKMNKVLVLLCGMLLLGACAKKRYYTPVSRLKQDFSRVNDTFHMGVTEVSNAQYGLFLEWLSASGQQDLRNNCQPDTAGWRMALPAAHYLENIYHRSAYYEDFPVVNISQEGALAYCKWLTLSYDSLKRKPFKKVRFRLPSREEWKKAAARENTWSSYPWIGLYNRDARGNYLANFRVIPDYLFARSKDGGPFYSVDERMLPKPLHAQKELLVAHAFDSSWYTCHVKGFFPNDHGLYNTVGNVSEMLDKKGCTAGGNWYSTGYYITLDAEDEFDCKATSSPYTGFRVLMEIIER